MSIKPEKKRNESERKRIDQRPKEAETRERIGDWEGDAIVGSDKSHILTHVDRHSRYTLLDKLERGLAELTKQTTIARFKSIPKNKKYTIVYNNGTTFTEHEKLEEATKIGIYFAYPYHSWERPTNENTNGLVREFFPKKSSFAKVTTEELEEVAYILNNKPRKCLNYATPAKVFHRKV